MARVGFAWLVLAALSVLLVFQINLHSDLLFLDSVMTDLFKFGGRWKDWKLTPAPAYFPDMLLYAIGYSVLPNPVMRIAFVSMGQALLLAGSCHWLATRIKPDLSRSALCAIVLMVATVVLVAAHSSMWLFFNSTNNHFAALLFSLLCTGWLLRYLERPRLVPALLLVTGGALAKASTVVFVINFTLPVLCTLGIALVILRNDRVMRWRLVQAAMILIASLAIVAGLDPLLVHHDALAGRVPLSAASALTSVKALLQATQVMFAADNLWTLVFAIVVSGCLVLIIFQSLLSLRVSRDDITGNPVSVVFEMSSGRWRYNLCALLLLVTLPVNVLSAIASGGFVDIYGYRYFAFPLCLGVLLSVLLLDSGEVFGQRLLEWVPAAGIASLSLLGMMSVKPLLEASGRSSFGEVITKGNLKSGPGSSGDFITKDNLKPRASIDAVASCLDRITDRGFDLGSGIADFWHARGVSYRVATPLHILPVLNNAMPFFHMMTLGPLRHPRHYELKPYNFAILRQSGSSTQFELKPDTLGRLLPSPTRVVRCESSDAEIWLYSDTAFDKFVERQIDQFLFRIGEGGEYRRHGDQLPSQVGKVSGTGRTANEGIDPSGYLSFGPYMDLPAGRYHVNIVYDSTGPGNKWDVGRFNDSDESVTLASGELQVTNQGHLDIGIEVKRPMRQVEIRTWFNGHGMLRLEQIRVIREETNRR